MQLNCITHRLPLDNNLKCVQVASCNKAGVESKKNHGESTGQLIFKNRSLRLFAMRFSPCQTGWTQILYIQSQMETGGHVSQAI